MKIFFSKNFYLLFFFLINQEIHPLTISEILYETSTSKYYNQVIEIYNNSISTIKLTDFKFQSGTRTNQIKMLSLAKQADFSFLNGIFSNEYLAPDKIAVIIDSGFRKEVSYDFKGSQVFTVDMTSFSSGNFLKKGEEINLLDKNNQIVDRWKLKEVIVDYSLIKIDFNQWGSANNLLPSSPNLGLKDELDVTLETFDRINLVENNNHPQILGIPQNYTLQCRKGVKLSLCNKKVFLNQYNDKKFKLYFYPHGSKNLIDPNDGISLTAGSSVPIILWPFNLGDATISFQNNFSPDFTLPIQEFNSILKDKIFINEIFYDTNKNLVWVEAFVQQTVNTALEIQLWNSDFKFKKSISISSQTYVANTYPIFAFHNQDFTNQFAWFNSSIDLGEKIDISAEGIVAFSDNTGFIDSVYYKKNWFSDYIFSRSLQRKTINGYAFTKDNFAVSIAQHITPGRPNDFSRTIFLNVKIINPMINKAVNHLKVNIEYPIKGMMSVFLYSPHGDLIGRVYNQEIEDEKEISICLQKANLIELGIYDLVFYYQTKDYGNKTIKKSFVFQN